MTDRDNTDNVPYTEGSEPWFQRVVDQILEKFPNEKIYTCAAGISPSGTVHFGNFRDVMTSYVVLKELVSRGKQARLLFSWDDFDRFRKVPNGIDPSFSRYIGMPLTSVPDPSGKFSSYAQRFEIEFEDSMRVLGVPLDYRYQTQEYKSGRYAEQIAYVLANRMKAADIQLQFKSDKGNKEKGIDPQEFRDTYFPVTVYSRFSGTDEVKVLSYDGGTVLTYECLKTRKIEQIDFAKTPIVKLPWKLDWPMRWGEENVHFEPGGRDHATPGGSFDVSRTIARELFGRSAPIFQEYEFVGIQGIAGGKMSGSKGGAMAPATLLEIYEPALLKWLYARRAPTQAFNLAFDTEVYRQYDEFDRAVKSWVAGDASPSQQKVISFCEVEPENTAISFKQAVALGQIVQWDESKVASLAESCNVPFTTSSIARRLSRAKSWLTTYNPEEMISLRSEREGSFIDEMSQQRRNNIHILHRTLLGEIKSAEQLEAILYAIPRNDSMNDKEMKTAQRSFFKDVYMILIGKDTGPRLSTFLWAMDRAKILALLDIKYST